MKRYVRSRRRTAMEVENKGKSQKVGIVSRL